MTTKERDAGQGSKRILMSMSFAILLHGIAFIMVQWILPLKPDEIPDFSGPLYVTFEDFEPEPVAAPAKAEAVIETAAPDVIQEQEVQPEPRTFVEAPVKIDAGKTPETVLPQVFRNLQYPPTTQRVTEEKPVAGISEIETPEVEHETVPFGIDTPVTEETSESQPAIPPKFLETEEEQKPLLFDMARLDDALQEKEDEQVIAGEGAESAEQAVGGDVASQKGPIITWEKPGEKRVLLSEVKLPDIPLWVKEEGLNLGVVVSFAVTPEGHTTSLKVERSSGYSDVDSSVLDAVRKLKFNPVSVEKNVLGRINYVIKTR
ncbi:MAG: TonB family protein [Spirochaetota bacterium]|nr:MAG: TonB family protein [Spirochaetota bacterium]